MQVRSVSPRVGQIVIGTEEHYCWLGGILKAIVVLNLLDALFTLAWVRMGLAVEANTFLHDLVHEQALSFMLAKLALVSLGAIFLWRIRTRPLAVVGIFGTFFVYYLVFLYHLQYSSHLLLGVLGW